MASSVKPYLSDNGPLILDGGLATELEAQGAVIQCDPLWSARLLQTNPQAISDAHYSGADVVTTATYQASVAGFISHMDVNPDGARELLMSGVHLARESVRKFVSSSSGGHSTEPRGPLVAGSVGPYGAFLHNGSEYTGAYAEEMSVEDLKAWHRPQLECIAAAGADLIAFETIPSLKEASALVELLREFPNSKGWLSFSCKDGTSISDGGLFTDAVSIAKRSTQLVAVGVNCCSPTFVEPILNSAQSLLSPELSWVVYPNSGEEWDHKLGWQNLGNSKDFITDLCHTWVKQGASIIGGCCRVTPTHISELRRHLKRTGPCPAPAVKI